MSCRYRNVYSYWVLVFGHWLSYWLMWVFVTVDLLLVQVWPKIFDHLVSSSFGVFRNTRYALIMSTCNNHLSNHNINQTFLMEKIALKTKATFFQLCCCLHDHLSNNIDYKCKTFALKASFAAFMLLIIAPMFPTIVAKKRTPQSILRLT